MKCKTNYANKYFVIAALSLIEKQSPDLHEYTCESYSANPASEWHGPFGQKPSPYTNQPPKQYISSIQFNEIKQF